MKVQIKVYPRSSREEVVRGEGQWKVYVRASATDGKANDAVVALLAKHLDVARSFVQIVRGEKSRVKLIEILKEKP